MAMIFFIYPSGVFVLLDALGFSFYGTNALTWAVVTFVLGLSVIMIYRLPHQLYNLLKGISNYGYFIKNKAVYLDGKRIKGADADSFTYFDKKGFYSKDKKHVYYNCKKIKNADAATFQPLAGDDTDSYWHDKNNAYHKWNLIAEADGATFVYAGQDYTFDKDNVFFENQLLKEADRATFEPLKEYIGRDCKNIFARSTLVKNVKDFASFELITISEEVFGKDKDQIYAIRYSPPYPLLPFPNADLETFEIVGDYYAKDKNQVYYYSYHIDEIMVLEGADAKNFTLFFDPIQGTDATDGERFYKAGVLCNELDSN